VNTNVLILLFRIGGGIILYLFLAAVVAVMWRDWRAVARQAEASRQAAAQPLGRLVVLQAGQSDLAPGQAIPLSVVTGLGRASFNTVVVEDAFASNEHARLSRRNDRWWLEDLGSRNGTLLNGERLNAPAIVSTGDEVGIGEVRLRIELA